MLDLGMTHCEYFSVSSLSYAEIYEVRYFVRMVSRWVVLLKGALNYYFSYLYVALFLLQS